MSEATLIDSSGVTYTGTIISGERTDNKITLVFEISHLKKNGGHGHAN
jgi:hypothetical protein